MLGGLSESTQMSSYKCEAFFFEGAFHVQIVAVSPPKKSQILSFLVNVELYASLPLIAER